MPFAAHLAEFGIVAPVGRNGVKALLDLVAKYSYDVPKRHLYLSNIFRVSLQ